MIFLEAMWNNMLEEEAQLLYHLFPGWILFQNSLVTGLLLWSGDWDYNGWGAWEKL